MTVAPTKKTPPMETTGRGSSVRAGLHRLSHATTSSSRAAITQPRAGARRRSIKWPDHALPAAEVPGGTFALPPPSRTRLDPILLATRHNRECPHGRRYGHGQGALQPGRNAPGLTGTRRRRPPAQSGSQPKNVYRLHCVPDVPERCCLRNVAGGRSKPGNPAGKRRRSGTSYIVLTGASHPAVPSPSRQSSAFNRPVPPHPRQVSHLTGRTGVADTMAWTSGSLPSPRQ
jgi:hypothetical protein